VEVDKESGEDVYKIEEKIHNRTSISSIRFRQKK